MKCIRKAYKATPELLQAILDDLARGLSRAQACAANGVSVEALIKWEKRPEFAGLRDKTEAARIKSLLQRIEDAGPYSGDWKRWQWILQKRFPEQFGDSILLAQQNNFYLDDTRSKELSDRAKRLLDSE